MTLEVICNPSTEIPVQKTMSTCSGPRFCLHWLLVIESDPTIS